ADPPGTRYQFERLGYFIGDVAGSTAERPVYNRTVTLRESWAGAGAGAGAGEQPRGRVSRRSPAQGPAQPSIPERSPDLQGRRERYEAGGVSAEAAEVITRDTATADFFDAALDGGGSTRGVAAWLVNELRGATGDRALADLPFPATDFGALVARVEAGSVSSSAGREVLAEMLERGEPADAVIERLGLAQVSDEAALVPVVEEVVAANPDKVEAYRGGKTGLLGFFMGQIMRRSGGRANPELAKRLVEERLTEG
ncbi:MAG: glutamine--tRNA ligase/YqeY domain fusion protein, partial [Longimicrobiales bacterium]